VIEIAWHWIGWLMSMSLDAKRGGAGAEIGIGFLHSLH
jgi:hypothetical protein